MRIRTQSLYIEEQPVVIGADIGVPVKQPAVNALVRPRAQFDGGEVRFVDGALHFLCVLPLSEFVPEVGEGGNRIGVAEPTPFVGSSNRLADDVVNKGRVRA